MRHAQEYFVRVQSEAAVKVALTIDPDSVIYDHAVQETNGAEIFKGHQGAIREAAKQLVLAADYHRRLVGDPGRQAAPKVELDPPAGTLEQYEQARKRMSVGSTSMALNELERDMGNG